MAFNDIHLGYKRYIYVTIKPYFVHKLSPRIKEKGQYASFRHALRKRPRPREQGKLKTIFLGIIFLFLSFNDCSELKIIGLRTVRARNKL